MVGVGKVKASIDVILVIGNHGMGLPIFCTLLPVACSWAIPAGGGMVEQASCSGACPHPTRCPRCSLLGHFSSLTNLHSGSVKNFPSWSY